MDPTAHHFAVTVSNLDRAVAFYRDTLGLDVLSEFSVGGDGFETGVGIDGASAEFVHMDAGDARIELVEYTPEGDSRSEGRLNQPGATHLGLEVADLDSVYESLPNGVETVAEPQTTESGTRILFVRDPDGTLVELLET
ncbi:VOC family protein [Haloarcula sp. S1CR25-12]|uniref:VOC family protein n=1 Tax=Haloarcula saliterrae TaxID=2950534 RepID=A0ABU2FEV7_9EURY|nr:VOC family protein [Haloarcula sp. S1CR25-12]MDS0260255.1 VOC family protein [Haloarcula sp. S1CR25-12]